MRAHHLGFMLKIDEPFELPDDPDDPVKTDAVLFNTLGLDGTACGKYPSPANSVLGGVLVLEVFINFEHET